MSKNRFTADNLKELGLIEISPGVYQPANKGKVSPYIKQQKGIVGERKVVGDTKAIDLKSSQTALKTRGRIEMKPMSVNKAWQGRRFKTKLYEAYEQSVLSVLKNTDFPCPPFRLTLTFGFSNKASDLDNPVKLFIDILQKKYLFNDKEIYELHVYKKIVDKSKEYCEYLIETI